MTRFPFHGGPLEDGRDSQVHSLIVHMAGDGRHSIGAYIQVYDDDIPLGVYEWHPNDTDQVLADIAENA